MKFYKYIKESFSMRKEFPDLINLETGTKISFFGDTSRSTNVWKSFYFKKFVTENNSIWLMNTKKWTSKSKNFMFKGNYIINANMRTTGKTLINISDYKIGK